MQKYFYCLLLQHGRRAQTLYSEFTVVKREANFTIRHVKGVPFFERRNIPVLSKNGIKKNDILLKTESLDNAILAF